MSETKDELYLQIINLKKYNDAIKQAMIDNCPHSMVQCGCELHYKQAGEEVCKVCRIASLEFNLDLERKINITICQRDVNQQKELGRLNKKVSELKDDILASQTEANDLRQFIAGVRQGVE